MASLERFQNSSLWSHNLYSRHFSPGLNHCFALWAKHRFPHREFTLSASSANNSRDGIVVKTRKSVKSNADLCMELREFVSMVGLPEGHVPSFNELLHHGRKDLAYIVRRRGYKLITELLSKSSEQDTNTDTSSAENQIVTKSGVNKSVGQEQEMSELVGDSISSYDDSKTNNCFSSENGISLNISSADPCGLIESGVSLSLLEKASKFVKDGELDNTDDDDLTETTGNKKTSVMNTSTPTSKLVPPLETCSDENLVVDPAHSQKDLDVENQKEMELYQLKEQVEKAKLALSTLQAKAEKEISKAQQIVSSKDEELRNTEESLSGLKEVQIEYWGYGETVEVAGSFNGWHHRIKMDCPPLPTSVGPNELRKSRLWSTVLWLYPGVYEIKFVVDGHWLIDSTRESVTRGTIHNNILRVDR